MPITFTLECKNGHRQTCGPEGPQGGVPFCPVCHKPMFPVQITTEVEPTAGTWHS